MAAVDPLRLTRFFDSPPGRSPASLKRVQVHCSCVAVPQHDDVWRFACPAATQRPSLGTPVVTKIELMM